MTKEQLEALKQGVPLEEVMAMATPEGGSAPVQEPEVPAAATGSASAAPAEPEPVATVEALQAQMAEMQATLQTGTEQIAKLTAEVAAKAQEADTFKASLVAAEAGNKSLMAALTPYVERMSTALGKPAKLDGMSASAAAEMHASIQADFQKAFPAGRRSQPANHEAKSTADAGMYGAKELKF